MFLGWKVLPSDCCATNSKPFVTPKKNRKLQRNFHCCLNLVLVTLAKSRIGIRYQIKKQRTQDQDLPNKDKSKIEVKNKKVLINGEPVVKQVLPIEVDEHFPNKQEHEKQDKLKLSTSDTVSEQGSNFVAYAFKTGQIHKVHRAYRKIRRIHSGATHVVTAYNLKGLTGQGHQDDEEHGAGYRLARMMEKNYPANMAVFVVRMYGGNHLGPKRFEIMEKTEKQAIQRTGTETLNK